MNIPPIHINFEQKRTLGEQIITQLAEHMLNQRLQPGDQLPPVRELAIQLRVNFNTVARAYRVLDDGGWISTQQGRGTYVREKQSDPAEEITARPASQIEAIKEMILLEAARSGTHPEQLINQIRAELIQSPELDVVELDSTGSNQAGLLPRRRPVKASRKARRATQKHPSQAARKANKRIKSSRT